MSRIRPGTQASRDGRRHWQLQVGSLPIRARGSCSGCSKVNVALRALVPRDGGAVHPLEVLPEASHDARDRARSIAGHCTRESNGFLNGCMDSGQLVRLAVRGFDPSRRESCRKVVAAAETEGALEETEFVRQCPRASVDGTRSCEVSFHAHYREFSVARVQTNSDGTS